VGTHSDLRYVILYTRDGEAREEFSVVPPPNCWAAVRAQQRVKSGRLGPGIRTSGLNVDRSMRVRINDSLADGPPVINWHGRWTRDRADAIRGFLVAAAPMRPCSGRPHVRRWRGRAANGHVPLSLFTAPGTGPWTR
jgi:hypothetical protein